MSQEDRRQRRIKKIMGDAAALLEAEGVKYFIGVVDRQPKDPGGGKAYAQVDITGEDMYHILDMALPTREDLKNLGIWVGQLIISREMGLKERMTKIKEKRRLK
jgi:hypothetical protein